MFLHIMVSQNPKKSNAKQTNFLISYDVILNYICTKSCMSQCKQKCKYDQEIIELNFNIYGICSIY
jgi:hypothetical protein